MKKNNLIKFTKVAWLMIMAFAIIGTSCKKDDDDDDDPIDPVIVLDGVYVKGASTALTDFDAKGEMKIAINEVTSTERAELLELFVAVKAGTDGFNIITVAGSTKTTYGPGDDFALVAEADLDGDEPKDGLWRGAIKETDAKFTVPEDGLYHVVFDTELMKVAIAKVNWGIIGGATPGGWGDNTVFTAPTFDLNTMTYEIPSVAVTEDIFKFRYSNGWKIIFSDDIKANTNFGGAVNALVPGGADIPNTTYANYKFTLTYTLGSAFAATMEYESDGEPLATFPEAMYLVGDGTAYGWDEPATHETALMHKCAGGGESEGLYWKILHIETGMGFKVSAAQWGTPNLGFADVEEFDANGVAITDNGGNMAVAESGMYMVVLDLRNDAKKLSVIAPEVYGMGDVFGSWDENVAANLFTVDNTAKTLTSPAFAADGSVRMYVSHEWIPAWWNAEFNVFSGVIEYRNDGGDQEAVAVTAGQTATLTFDDNTGVIQ